MGRSFSFSAAWERNERMQRRQRAEELAQQLAERQGIGDHRLADPSRSGDPLEKELHRSHDVLDGRETNWVGYREGSELTLDGNFRHGGNRIVALNKEVDYDRGEHRYRYVVEGDDGGTAGEYEACWEQTGEKQWTLKETRRVTS